MARQRCLHEVLHRAARSLGDHLEGSRDVLLDSAVANADLESGEGRGRPLVVERHKEIDARARKSHVPGLVVSLARGGHPECHITEQVRRDVPEHGRHQPECRAGQPLVRGTDGHRSGPADYQRGGQELAQGPTDRVRKTRSG